MKVAAISLIYRLYFCIKVVVALYVGDTGDVTGFHDKLCSGAHSMSNKENANVLALTRT